MLKNYLTVAWRNITRNKAHSLINMLGLSLGMAGAILLLLNIRFGLSMDEFHTKKANLYEAYNKGIVNGQLTCWNATAPPLAPALQASFPDIKNAARVLQSGKLFRYADKKIQASGIFTDPAFMSMFSFPLTQGSPATALDDPNDVVLTEKLATKLFGTEDPMGKIITTPTGDNFRVSGICKDLPDNTRFKFEYLLSWKYFDVKGRSAGTWNNGNSNTFVELDPKVHIDAFNKKIAGTEARNSNLLSGQQVFLYKMTESYFRGRFTNGKPSGGAIDNLRMLGILAGIILLIACINFMNLSTARSEKRAKEVGVRKVIGAGRKSLILQFIGESILMATLAGIAAFVIAGMAVPSFSELIDAKLSIPWTSPAFWAMALGFILLTGVLAGSYPALYLSSFKPVRVLKGALKTNNAVISPRKILVVLQFVFSIFLINFMVVFQKQMHYGLNRETGFVKDNLVSQPMTSDLLRNYTAVKNELLSSGVASSVCKQNTTVTDITGEVSGLKWEGMDPKANPAFVIMQEGGNFIHTNGLTLLAGRDIDLDKYASDTLSCVINEATARILGFKQPVGRIIMDEDVHWKIVGLVKDFLIGDPGEGDKQVIIYGAAGNGVLVFRLTGSATGMQTAQKAEAIIKKYNPNYITQLRFADEDYAAKFKQARNTGSLINIFALLAIVVSCMGLLGLSTYMAENRTKEIGIRKVLGASVASITALLTQSFVQLIGVSIVIATPLSWIFMHNYLQRYSYRTSLSVWVLVAAAVGALTIAILTIAFQTIRAALSNPVRSLRSE